jgi:hypothetical protein
MSAERRAALEAAFDAAEKEAEDQEVELEEEELPDESDAELPDTEVDEEAGEEESEGEDESEKPDPQKVEQEAAVRKEGKPSGKSKPVGKGTSKTDPENKGQLREEVKAPQSWTPAEREHWAKMPPEAQKAVQRRELEVQQALSRSADSRKFQDSFVRTVQPYAHLIRAQNSSPLQAVNNLMQTAAGLMTGTQPQKAAIVSEIIQNYGVDIQVLDDVLSKRPIQQSQGQSPAALPAPVAEALKPIHQFMTQAEQARAQQIQQITQQAQETVAQYSEKLPFFDDLRDEMADLMEVAAGRGRVMTIEQAHEIALNSNPQIKKIIDQRNRAARLKQDPNKILRAKKAGASIKGAPSNGAGNLGGKPTSRRQALLEAWDDASG